MLATESITLGSSSVIVQDAQLVDQSASMVEGSITADGKKLQATIKGGTSGELYDVIFRVQTSGSEKYEKKVVLDVRD